MRITRHRLVVALPSVAALSMMLLGASGAPARPGSQAERAVVDAWIDAHSASLPSTLNSLFAMPKAYRGPIFAKLTPAQQTALWREQLGTFLLPPERLSGVQTSMVRAVGIQLNEAQRAAIRVAIDSAPFIYDLSIPKPEREALANRLCRRKGAVFEPRPGGLIFASWGPADEDAAMLDLPPDQPHGVAQASVVAGFSALVTAAAIRLGDLARPPKAVCDCAQASFCDCIGWCDFQGGSNCGLPDNPWGCGCGHIFVCDGLC